MFKTVSIRPDGDAEWSRRRFLVAATTAAGTVLLASRAGLPAATWENSTTNSDLCFISALTLAKMIRAKQVSSAEVVQAFLDRIAAVNPEINAAVYVAAIEAQATAREADAARAAGENRGPLHGVPVSVKDCYEVADMPTTNGAPGLKDDVSQTDAVVVERMKKAGAIVVAKTNVPFLCCWYESSNLLHGRTSNPYDLERTAGGSSGGDAGCGRFTSGHWWRQWGQHPRAFALVRHRRNLSVVGPGTGGRLPSANGREQRTSLHVGWSHGALRRESRSDAAALERSRLSRRLQFFNMPLLSPQDVRLAKLRVAFFTPWVNEYGEAARPSAETVTAVEQAAATLGQYGATMAEKCPPNAEMADRITRPVDRESRVPEVHIRHVGRDLTHRAIRISHVDFVFG